MGDDGVRGDDVREPGAWILWLAAAPGWTGPVVLVALWMPIWLALPLALFGHSSSELVVQGATTVVGWAVVVAVSGRRRRRPLRGLDRTTRERVARTVLTGVPDGDPRVDRRAAELLRRSEQSGKVTRRVAWRVLVSVALVAFVGAAWRSSAWWLAVGAVDVAGLTAVLLPWLSHDRDAARARFASNRDDPVHLDEG